MYCFNETTLNPFVNRRFRPDVLVLLQLPCGRMAQRVNRAP